MYSLSLPKSMFILTIIISCEYRSVKFLRFHLQSVCYIFVVLVLFFTLNVLYVLCIDFEVSNSKYTSVFPIQIVFYTNLNGCFFSYNPISLLNIFTSPTYGKRIPIDDLLLKPRINSFFFDFLNMFILHLLDLFLNYYDIFHGKHQIQSYR